MDARYLGELVSRIAKDAKIIIASNREPVTRERTAGGIRVERPASGMVAALKTS